MKGYIVSNRWLSVFNLLLSFYRTYQLYRRKMSPPILGRRNIGKWTDLLRLDSFRMIRIRISNPGSLTWIIMHQEWSHRFLWCTMIRVILGHWSHKGQTPVLKYYWFWWEQNWFACCALSQKGKYQRNPLLKLSIENLTLKGTSSNINLTIWN